MKNMKLIRTYLGRQGKKEKAQWYSDNFQLFQVIWKKVTGIHIQGFNIANLFYRSLNRLFHNRYFAGSFSSN